MLPWKRYMRATVRPSITIFLCRLYLTTTPVCSLPMIATVNTAPAHPKSRRRGVTSAAKRSDHGRPDSCVRQLGMLKWRVAISKYGAIVKRSPGTAESM